MQPWHCVAWLLAGPGLHTPSSLSVPVGRWRSKSHLGAVLSCVGVGGYEERAMAVRKARCAGQAGKGVRMGGSEALKSMVRSACAGR
jgi:hypothetical protein